MRYSSRRSPLFLTELIFSLLIFSLCAAVCAGLLVYAHQLSARSEQLTEALLLAETIAEEFKSGQPFTQAPDNYSLITALSSENGVDYLEITVSFRGEVIYCLTAARTQEGGTTP